MADINTNSISSDNNNQSSTALPYTQDKEDNSTPAYSAPSDPFIPYAYTSDIAADVNACDINELPELVVHSGFNDYRIHVELVYEIDDIPTYRFSNSDLDIDEEFELNESLPIRVVACIARACGIVQRFVKFDPVAAFEAFMRASDSYCFADYRISIRRVYGHYELMYTEVYEHDGESDTERKYVRYAEFARRVNSPEFMDFTSLCSNTLIKALVLDQRRLIFKYGHGDQKLQLIDCLLEGTGIEDFIGTDGFNFSVNASINDKFNVASSGSHLLRNKAGGDRRILSSGHNYATKTTMSVSILSSAIVAATTGKGTAAEHRQVDPKALAMACPNALSLLDRGYYVTHFIAKLVDNKQLFIIRVKDSCNYKVQRITTGDGKELEVPEKTISPSNKLLTKKKEKGEYLPTISANDPKIRELAMQYGELNVYVEGDTYLPAEDITPDYDTFFEPLSPGKKHRRCRVPNLRLCIRYSPPDPRYNNSSSESKGSFLYLITNILEETFKCSVICLAYGLRWNAEHGVKALRQGDGLQSTHSRSIYFNQECISFALLSFAFHSYIQTRAETTIMSKMCQLDMANIAHILEHTMAAEHGTVRAARNIILALKYLRNRRQQRPSIPKCKKSVMFKDIDLLEPYRKTDLEKNILTEEQLQKLVESKDEGFELLNRSAQEIADVVYHSLVFGATSKQILRIMRLDWALAELGLNTKFTSNILYLHNVINELGLDPALAFKRPQNVESISMLAVHRNDELKKRLSTSMDYVSLRTPCCSKKHDLNSLPPSKKKIFSSFDDIVKNKCKECRLSLVSYERGTDNRIRLTKMLALQHPDKMAQWREIVIESAYSALNNT